MDIEQTLGEALRIARAVQMDGGDRIDAEATERLAELVIAIDAWMKMGGFLPGTWAQHRSTEGDA